MKAKPSQEYTFVRLPTKSVAVLEERVRTTEFDSVSAYLTFLIEELSHQTEDIHDHDNDHEREGQQPSEMDDEAIEQRLRSLGYLDG